ncbi:hypothetical protein HDF10_003113 [Edaphobacter lichenicola]|uniref:Uncharacterized protein n=1 Tax=Tunturiibacter lichenicola TaxID=2051959 RepID=A0A7W8N424_9BACT|nr:hypothetical protein [Edaphobacter lichenicola]
MLQEKKAINATRKVITSETVKFIVPEVLASKPVEKLICAFAEKGALVWTEIEMRSPCQQRGIGGVPLTRNARGYESHFA